MRIEYVTGHYVQSACDDALDLIGAEQSVQHGGASSITPRVNPAMLMRPWS